MKRLKGICTPQGGILIHTSYPPSPPCPPAFYQVPWQVAGTQVFSWAKGHTSSSGWVCSAFHDRFHPCLSVINSIWKFFNPTFCIIHKIVDLCSLWAPWCLSVMSNGFQSSTLSKGKSLSWEHIMQCGSKVSKMDFSTLSPVQWSHYAYLVIPNKKLICDITLNSRRLLRGILNWPADQSECFIYIKKYP